MRLTKFAKKIWIISSLLIISLLLRGVFLNKIPGGFHGDEGEWSYYAYQINQGLRPKLFGLGWDNHPNLFSYLQALSLNIFGANVFGARILSAITGSLLTIVVYLIGCRLFGSTSGLIASLILAFSPWAIQYSRLAMNDIQVVLFFSLFSYWLIKAYKNQQNKYFFLSGLSLGLTAFFGNKTLMAIFSALALIVYLRFTAKKFSFKLKNILIIILGFSLTIGPLIITSPQLVNQTLERIRQKSLLQDVDQSLSQTLKNQLVKNSLVFFKNYDQIFFKNLGPLISWPLNIILVLGLLITLVRFKKNNYGFMAVWFITGWLGSLISVSPPNSHRMILALPAAYLIIGQTLVAGFKRIKNQTLGNFGLAAFLLISVTISFYQYFIWSQSRWPWLNVTLIAREISKFSNEYFIYNFLAPSLHLNHGTIKFIAKAPRGESLETPKQIQQALITVNPNSQILFVFPSNRNVELELIKKRFPYGKIETVEYPDEQLLFTKYILN